MSCSCSCRAEFLFRRFFQLLTLFLNTHPDHRCVLVHESGLWPSSMSMSPESASYSRGGSGSIFIRQDVHLRTRMDTSAVLAGRAIYRPLSPSWSLLCSSLQSRRHCPTSDDGFGVGEGKVTICAGDYMSVSVCVCVPF